MRDCVAPRLSGAKWREVARIETSRLPPVFSESRAKWRMRPLVHSETDTVVVLAPRCAPRARAASRIRLRGAAFRANGAAIFCLDFGTMASVQDQRDQTQHETRSDEIRLPVGWLALGDSDWRKLWPRTICRRCGHRCGRRRWRRVTGCGKWFRVCGVERGVAL